MFCLECLSCCYLGLLVISRADIAQQSIPHVILLLCSGYCVIDALVLRFNQGRASTQIVLAYNFSAHA